MGGVALADRRRLTTRTCVAPEAVYRCRSPMPFAEHITSDPGICGGRPVVAGTRLRVSDVLDALASGASEADLLANFSYLSKAALRACLAYAARATDHPVVGLAA